MKRERHYYVYIMANEWNTTFYVGQTNNLLSRAEEHKTGFNEGSFSKQYHLTKLVYYEVADSRISALEREHQLKNWRREWKINLIRSMNPTMEDLTRNLYEDGDAETSSASSRKETEP